MYKFAKILSMDLVNLVINPIWVFYGTVFPFGLVLIIGFLASGAYGNTVTSYDYYGVALMIFSIFNAATFSANSFMEERIKSPNMRIVFSPVPSFYIHFSKVLATFLFCSVSYSIITFGLYFTVGVNYGGNHFWAPYIIMLASLFLFSSLGVLVCCMFKSEGSANQLLSFLFAIFAILGGVFFPIEGFGKMISAVSWISPAKWILAACMQIIYDQDFSMFLPACIVIITLAFVCIFLSAKLFKGEEYI